MARRKSLLWLLSARLIPAATGGYTYYEDLPIKVFMVHTAIFMYLFVLPVVLVMLPYSHITSLVHVFLTSVIWFLIKLFNYLIHQQFDQHSDDEDQDVIATPEPEPREDDSPPFGISQAVWNIRHRITDFGEVDVDTVVSELIQQGYNPNELFLFFEYYFSGQLSLSPDDGLIETSRPVVPTTLKLCCCKFTGITWTRKELEQWFDRPLYVIDVFVAPIVTVACGIVAYYNGRNVGDLVKACFVLSCASAQFSLLRAPNPDSFSTTIQDPTAPYARAYHILIFHLLFWVSNLLIDAAGTDQVITMFDMQLSYLQLVTYFNYAVKILIIVFPIFNALGILGGLRSSICGELELIQRIFLGTSGCLTYVASIVTLVINVTVLMCFVVIHFYWGNNASVERLVLAMASTYGVFLASWNLIPFYLSKLSSGGKELLLPENFKLFKWILFVMLRCLVNFFVIYIMLHIDALGTLLPILFICSLEVVVCLLHHFFIPTASMKYPYSLWSGPLFFRERMKYLNSYLRVVQILERNLLIPACLACLLAQSRDKCLGFSKFPESVLLIVMAIGCNCSAHVHMVRFCLVLILILLNAEDDQYLLFRLFIYLIVCWKVFELMSKFGFVVKYASLHSLTHSYQILLLALILANCQFVVLMILMATLLTAPIVTLCGLTFFLPSYNRSTTFWEDPTPFQEKPGDALFYKVISDALSLELQNYVMKGKLLEFGENDFYFICDDYFNAIIHIVATGANYVTFQLRGLEVREQTLCHQNELNVVRTDLEEMDVVRGVTIERIWCRFTQVVWQFMERIFAFGRFPPILKKNARVFAGSATWSTLFDDLTLNSYSVSANNLGLIFPDKYHQDMLITSIIRVLTLVIDEFDEIEKPETTSEDFPPDIVDEGRRWMAHNGKEHLEDQIFGLCHVLLDQMAKIPGGFEWQVYQLFVTHSFDLNTYVWVPSTADETLVKVFRVSVGIAVHDVVGDLPEDDDELAKYIRDRINNLHFLPEDDPAWSELVFSHVDELETLRQITDESGVTIKHMHFKYCPQRFKMVHLNPESVLGIWAGQILETVYIETDDRERTSVQFDQFTLRNIISQSANLPIGYPEAICPLTYSFSDVY